MILRAVLAVALATAVVGLALPLATDAASQRAASAGERASAALAEAAGDLADSDVVRAPGAREQVTVSLPDGPLVGVSGLAVGGIPPGDDGRPIVAYRLSTGGWRVGAHLPMPACDGECGGPPLVVRDDATLRLSLDGTADGRVARVSVRRLKGENRTTRAHA